MVRWVPKGICASGIVVWVLICSCPVRAGGSFSRDDLAPVLAQSPIVAEWIAGALELDETGDAVRIGQNINPHLGGMRVGPYVLSAKPKGAPGPFTLEVTVETKLVCLDAAGKATDIGKARRIREEFESVVVRPLAGTKP